MAQTPTVEDNARTILKILTGGGAQVRQGSLISQVNMQFITNGGVASDFTAAAQYAEKQGWITPGPNNFILLTQAGFDEA